MPQARTSILRAKCDSDSKHEHTLRELQRMFAYLLVSNFNPRDKLKQLKNNSIKHNKYLVNFILTSPLVCYL